ncbi:MAG: CPBP family intramembrane metalloprotease [Deltaproteobacteria bacterium]|nr:CPBP family intramembrane metalloprotease [Deltaproteobacteria bacterium]
MAERPNRFLSPVFHVGGLGLVFLIYLGILRLGTTRLFGHFPWWQDIAPNLWLLSASLLWISRFSISFKVSRGSTRTALGAIVTIVMAGLVIAMAALWPGKGTVGIRPVPVADWLGLMLLVPVAEELFFRGLVLNHFIETLKMKTSAALVTSFLFGLAHMHQGSTILVAMILLSLLLSAITIATSSLIWPIAIHVGWNTLSIIREASLGKERIVIAAVGIIALFALLKRGTHTEKKS